MSSFTYLSKAAVVLAAAALATATEEAMDHIRRLSSSEEEEEDDPYQSEMNRQLFMSGCTLFGMVIGVFILIALHRCVNLNDHQLASVQPAPKRILSLMSIEPALNFTNGLTFAGGADHPECTVCLSEFSEGEEIRILSNCGHGFHLKCIETWLLSRSSCPTCRTSCVKTSAKNNPPENQHDLEAAHPPAIELMVLHATTSIE